MKKSELIAFLDDALPERLGLTSIKLSLIVNEEEKAHLYSGLTQLQKNENFAGGILYIEEDFTTPEFSFELRVK